MKGEEKAVVFVNCLFRLTAAAYKFNLCFAIGEMHKSSGGNVKTTSTVFLSSATTAVSGHHCCGWFPHDFTPRRSSLNQRIMSVRWGLRQAV